MKHYYILAMLLTSFISFSNFCVELLEFCVWYVMLSACNGNFTSFFPICRTLFIFFLISSLTYWLFRNVLFNLHVFVLLTVFFLVIDIYSHSIFVVEDASYNFSFLIFTEVWFLTQDLVYPGKCSMCT